MAAVAKDICDRSPRIAVIALIRKDPSRPLHPNIKRVGADVGEALQSLWLLFHEPTLATIIQNRTTLRF
ncbi:MAG: hypothetical protein P8Y36_05660, partial [Alphaproteobacteria bacterium]